MPYIYPDVEKLEGTKKVGTKQCVALLQHYSRIPQTILWKEGKSVFGDITINKGVAIATFEKGKYSRQATGNHAAYYISQDSGGIWIMDQWSSDEKKPYVSKRYIRKKGRLASGQFVDPSNNAEAYSVIE